MKFFSQTVAAAVMLLASGSDAAWERYRLSDKFGEPHGTFFTDSTFATAGQSVHSVTIRTGERVNGVGIDVTSPDGNKNNPFHGGNGGNPQTLTLNSGERFKCLEAHWGKYKSRTRIFYIKISTTSGRSIAGGTTTTKNGTVCAPDGFQLGGFAGSSGVELDQEITPSKLVEQDCCVCNAYSRVIDEMLTFGVNWRFGEGVAAAVASSAPGGGILVNTEARIGSEAWRRRLAKLWWQLPWRACLAVACCRAEICGCDGRHRALSSTLVLLLMLACGLDTTMAAAMIACCGAAVMAMCFGVGVMMQLL
ncbi:uncharacterized protein IUM83_15673 [Phytophthora cinnamomi]|uniref:uncharacterized protein n=1 Tax=Phytophthora cinnamomi TaxID=4785 RepID=UPI00355A1C01|nr:hypothetical protein IUM83_15673 [Phytophthora cinnamomi]